jgi:hypothetical protein
MRKRNYELVYYERLKNQREALERFADDTADEAEALAGVYRRRKKDMPDDEYRSCAFFMNREYRNKNGSLFLLYRTKEKLKTELPSATDAAALDRIRYQFRVFTQMLAEGKYL